MRVYTETRYTESGKGTMSRRKKLGYREVLPGMFVAHALVGVWELITTPAVSHSNTWQGVWVSLMALPIGAFLLAKHPGAQSRFFLYGCAGSLLFLWRFLNMDRFSLWLEYQAPSNEVIVGCWVLFSLGMGTVCWLVAKARIESNNATEKKHVGEDWHGA